MEEKMRYYAFWLSGTCIVMFILQLVIPGFTDLLVLNKSSFTEPWRFLSAIFLHGGIVHLIYNLFALLMFGFILEKKIGSWKFLSLFLIGGIIANLIAVNFYDSSLGASGAIYSVIGCLTLLMPMLTVWAFSLPMPMFLACIVWAAGDIIQTFVPSSGIGTIAHLSGLAVGLLFGLLILLQEKKHKTKNKLNYFHIRENYQQQESKRKVEIPEEIIDDWEKRHMRR
jgi:membrane associated rhomboid family serine protease